MRQTTKTRPWTWRATPRRKTGRRSSAKGRPSCPEATVTVPPLALVGAVNSRDNLAVDGDEPEEAAFGPSQYTDSDVAVKLAKDKQAEKDGQSQVATVNSSGDVEVKVESGQQCDSNVSTSDAEPSSRAQLIEELRSRIRQLEAEGGEATTSTDAEDYKCLICLVRIRRSAN